MKASEIARLLGAELRGAGDPEITGVAPIEQAVDGQLTFLASRRYARYVQPARAAVFLVSEKLLDALPEGRAAIVVRGDAHQALAVLLETMYPETPSRPGIHPTAVLEGGAEVGRDARIDAYAIVGANSRLGEGVRIGAHCVVGPECRIGDGVVLHAHVTLYRRTRIGARSIVHSGARLGVDGFGYVPERDRHRKVPQVGDCLIGEDVEIGANTTIDRGSVGSTVIGDGVKIDNLVHIGHNVHVGERAIIVAQVGISGSVRVGRGATLAGQAGLSGHLEIGDGATVAAQAGVFGDIEAGTTVSGYPARPHRETLRAHAALFRLPRLMERLKRLERAVFARTEEE